MACKKIRDSLCHDDLQLAQERTSPPLDCLALGARKADRRWYISEFIRILGRANARREAPASCRVPDADGKRFPAKEGAFSLQGRWIPNKGLRILLKAYHRLAPNPDSWPLILLGDGPLRQEVERLSRKGERGVQLLDSFPKRGSEDTRSKVDGHATPYPRRFGLTPWRHAPLASLHSKQGWRSPET